jgi:beta-galactosidase
MLDGQVYSIWHTEWQEKEPVHPHQVVIDLGEPAIITGIRYLPRQDNANGRIKHYKLYLKDSMYRGL